MTEWSSLFLCSNQSHAYETSNYQVQSNLEKVDVEIQVFTNQLPLSISFGVLQAFWKRRVQAAYMLGDFRAVQIDIIQSKAD